MSGTYHQVCSSTYRQQLAWKVNKSDEILITQKNRRNNANLLAHRLRGALISPAFETADYSVV